MLWDHDEEFDSWFKRPSRVSDHRELSKWYGHRIHAAVKWQMNRSSRRSEFDVIVTAVLSDDLFEFPLAEYRHGLSRIGCVKWNTTVAQPRQEIAKSPSLIGGARADMISMQFHDIYRRCRLCGGRCFLSRRMGCATGNNASCEQHL
jgi:hypothetical protein